MPVLNRRLSKLEAKQPPPPPMSEEEREARINELLAKCGTTYAQELERHGSLQAMIEHVRKDIEASRMKAG